MDCDGLTIAVHVLTLWCRSGQQLRPSTEKIQGGKRKQNKTHTQKKTKHHNITTTPICESILKNSFYLDYSNNSWVKEQNLPNWAQWSTWARKLPANVLSLIVKEKTIHFWSVTWFKIPHLYIKKVYNLLVPALILLSFPCKGLLTALVHNHVYSLIFSPTYMIRFCPVTYWLFWLQFTLMFEHAILTHSSTDLKLSFTDFSAIQPAEVFDYYSLIV